MGYTLWWLSHDRQAEVELGTFASRELAEQAITDAWKFLRAETPTDPQQWAANGDIKIVEEEK
jgi:hypothetical protein